MPTDTKFDPTEVEEFLTLVKDGVGKLSAAVTVGWSPAELNQFLDNSDNEALVKASLEMRMEEVEQTVWRLAKKGNISAIQMVLYNFGTDRGWRPPQQQVRIDQKVEVTSADIEGVRAAVLETLRNEGAAALQPPPAAIEAAARDD